MPAQAWGLCGTGACQPPAPAPAARRLRPRLPPAACARACRPRPASCVLRTRRLPVFSLLEGVPRTTPRKSAASARSGHRQTEYGSGLRPTRPRRPAHPCSARRLGPSSEGSVHIQSAQSGTCLGALEFRGGFPAEFTRRLNTGQRERRHRRREDRRGMTKRRMPGSIRRSGPGIRSAHSHSMVPGGLEVTSRTTRLTSRTSFVMRFEMRASTS